MRLPSLIVPAFVLGLTAAAAAAPVPTAEPVHPVTPAASCSTPSETDCLKKGFLETPCGLANLATCKDFIQDDFKAKHAAAGAPKVKMLRPTKSEMPGDVREGSYYAYKPSKKFSSAYAATAKKYKVKRVVPKASGKTLKSQQPAFAAARGPYSTMAPVDELGHVDPNEAAKAHRRPEWEAQGSIIQSCEEFGYEANYDVLRFADAAAACRGDRECIFDVAYMPSTPGIARRVLADQEGHALAQQFPKVSGNYPKNDLFLATAKFVRSRGMTPIPATTETAELEAAMSTGAAFYKIGSCSGNACNRVRKFHDEWDWHETMRQKHTAMSHNEHEEFERRRAQFRNLWAQLDAAVRSEQEMLNQVATSTIPVMPYDEVTHDMFERYELGRDMIRKPDEFKAIEKKWGADIWNKSLDQVKSKVQGAAQHGRRPSMAVGGVLAMPSPQADKPKQPKGPGAGATPTNGPETSMSDCLKPGGWGLEMVGKGPISCRIGAFLRAEWARKKAGKRSCLDLDDAGCDWEPSSFQDRMVARMPLLERQQLDEDYCRAWIASDDLPLAGVSTVRDRLAANKAAFEAAWKQVKDYDLGHDTNGRRLGKTWKDADYAGDKDWFASGWRYDLGWTIESLQKTGNDVCQIGGDVHADAGIDAWVVGHKVSVIDGQVRARSNYQGDGQTTHRAHLEILGETVFNEPNGEGWATSQTFGPRSKGDVFLKLPDPAIYFYIGAYISGKLWGELMYGANVSVSGEASNGCNVDAPVFGLHAKYEPFFGAYGMGQVGAGIAGVASAGIRLAINIVTLGIPVGVGMSSHDKGSDRVITFQSKVAATLSSLSGRISAYVEVWPIDEEWEVFRWNGLGPVEIPLMPPLSADVGIAGLR